MKTVIFLRNFVLLGVLCLNLTAFAASNATIHHGKQPHARPNKSLKSTKPGLRYGYDIHAKVINYSSQPIIVRLEDFDDPDVGIDPNGGQNIDYIDVYDFPYVCTNITIFSYDYNVRLFSGCVSDGVTKTVYDPYSKQSKRLRVS